MSATASAPPPPAASSARDAPARAWWRGDVASEVALATAAGLLALAAVAVVLRLWDARPGLPWGYGGDGLWLAQVVKGMVDNGWITSNPDVGAPFGQELYDFTGALGDNLQFLIMKVMSVVSQDPVKIVNAYFLLGFFLCAATACIVLRRLGVSRGAAVVAAVLFSLLPAHVGGGLGRVLLGAYWAIPFSALLIMRVFAGEPLFARRTGGRRLARWASWRTLGTAAMCFLIAGTGLYYALFTVILLTLAAAAVLIARRDWRAALGGAVATLLVLAIFVVHVSPSILYTHRHGPNPTLSARPVGDSNVYATNLAQLILPVLGHRLAAAAELSARMDKGKPFPGDTETSLSALGLLASLGFLGMLLVAVVPGVRAARERAGPATATAVAVFLLGTTGGIGLLIALFVTTGLRGWGRISPLLGFVGLFAVAIAYDALRARVGASRPRSWRLYGVAALLPVALVVGVADQTTTTMIPAYKAAGDQYRSDASFVDHIEAALPDGAGVLQLPAAAFPENGPIVNMADYSHMRGPLHTRDLRFSYGSMKGRPHGDWVQRLAGLPLADGLSYYVAAGFRGIWVDRRGYADAGAAIDKQLRALPGEPPPLVSGDENLRFYSLVDYAHRWAADRTPGEIRNARDSALNLSELALAAGTNLVPGSSVPQIENPPVGGSFVLRNPGRLARAIEMRGRLFVDGHQTIVIAQLPGGGRVRLTARRGRGAPFTLRTRVAPESNVTVRVSSAAVRRPLQFPELLVTDAVLRPR